MGAAHFLTMVTASYLSVTRLQPPPRYTSSSGRPHRRQSPDRPVLFLSSDVTNSLGTSFFSTAITVSPTSPTTTHTPFCSFLHKRDKRIHFPFVHVTPAAWVSSKRCQATTKHVSASRQHNNHRGRLSASPAMLFKPCVNSLSKLFF